MFIFFTEWVESVISVSSVFCREESRQESGDAVKAAGSAGGAHLLL